MSVKKEDVLYTAELARLKVDDDECLELENDLNSILGYFEKLNELDTRGVKPTANVMDIKNRMRDDVVKHSLSSDTALKNASSTKDGYFKVPRIME